MWTEAELDDEHFHSVYGADALHARYRKIVEHYEAKYAATMRHLDALDQRLASLRASPPQGP